MTTNAAQKNEEPRLEPQELCTVCGSAELDTLASREEIAAQQRWLRVFHRRRLRKQDASSLEERADFTQDQATAIAICRRCGLVLRAERPSEEAVTEAYESDEYGRERLDALFESQLELFRPKARELQARLGQRGSEAGLEKPVVLEIGSFVGGFLAAGQELGWRVTGIDPGREVARFCKQRGLSVLRESVDDCEFAEASADCICIWNTFDQLPDPHPTLRSAARWLRPEGLLAIRIPNGDCFAACMRTLARTPRALRSTLLAAMAWNNLLSFPYLQGYSLPTLDRLLGDYGFERVDNEGDVLTRLADEQTKRWAALEESLLKAAWKRAARSGFAPAPWLDVFYRSAAAAKD